jgi:PAS domain-containing protein
MLRGGFMSHYGLFDDETEEEAGIYSWCLDTDTLYGDTAIAALFGLDPSATVRGLPLSAYLDRIAAQDRQAVAGSIARAVADGQPYRSEYRVINRHGTPRLVMALGRCFRDKNSNPINYSGIIYPIDRL